VLSVTVRGQRFGSNDSLAPALYCFPAMCFVGSSHPVSVQLLLPSFRVRSSSLDDNSSIAFKDKKNMIESQDHTIT
jgi:hypothetical protein